MAFPFTITATGWIVYESLLIFVMLIEHPLDLAEQQLPWLAPSLLCPTSRTKGSLSDVRSPSGKISAKAKVDYSVDIFFFFFGVKPPTGGRT